MRNNKELGISKKDIELVPSDVLATFEDLDLENIFVLQALKEIVEYHVHNEVDSDVTASDQDRADGVLQRAKHKERPISAGVMSTFEDLDLENELVLRALEEIEGFQS